jgi:hypothetical protein
MGPKKLNTWGKDNMMRAIMAVRNKEMGLLRASKLYDGPKSTLKDKVNHKEQNVEKLVNIRIGRKPILPETLENSLVSYYLIMGKQFLDLLSKMSRERHSNWHLRMAFRTHFLTKTQRRDGNGFIILCAVILS